MDTIFFSDLWSIGHSIQTPRGSGNSIIVSKKAHKEFQMLITKENLLRKIYFQRALNNEHDHLGDNLLLPSRKEWGECFMCDE